MKASTGCSDPSSYYLIEYVTDLNKYVNSFNGTMNGENHLK